jgi:hypothetical protein
MLKIRRIGNGEVVFVVSGRLEFASLCELSALIAKESPACSVVLDLEDLDLVDREAVKVLRTYTEKGIELRNCPHYASRSRPRFTSRAASIVITRTSIWCWSSLRSLRQKQRPASARLRAKASRSHRRSCSPPAAVE